MPDWYWNLTGRQLALLVTAIDVVVIAVAYVCFVLFTGIPRGDVLTASFVTAAVANMLLIIYNVSRL